MAEALYNVYDKIRFMDEHGIDISILSIGNPWLDFLTEPSEREAAEGIASRLNNNYQIIAELYPGRIFFFALLPLTAPLPAILSSITEIKGMASCRGVVMGYNGFGDGLDDPNFFPVLQGLANAGLPIFFHPNYGIPGEVFGPCCASYGQTLPVSLGFTFETTQSITRMYLAGVFDRLPGLKVILSHAGGMLPFIAGRIDATLANFSSEAKPDKSIHEVLRQNVWLDGITFDKTALRAAMETVGIEKVMFGTDHPLFPSQREDGRYDSFVRNQEATAQCFGEGSNRYNAVMGQNAIRELKLK